MIWKALTLLAVAVAVIGMIRKAMQPFRHRTGATDLLRCTRCGAWHDPTAPCGTLPPRA